MSIWAILLFGFSQALFWRTEYSFEGDQTEWQKLIGVIYITFGDFHETDLFSSGFDWLFFFVNVFIICIVMMNLLVGILSEKLADILEIESRVNYEALLDVVFTLEVMRSWFLSKDTEKGHHHLVFVRNIEDTKPENFKEREKFRPIERLVHII
jgi:hypothetical protein